MPFSLVRVDQGTACTIIAVKTVQVGAGDQKSGNAATVISDLNPVQAAAQAQQKCTPEQIGDFDGTFYRGPHLLSTT
jgi:hypothetical protein